MSHSHLALRPHFPRTPSIHVLFGPSKTPCEKAPQARPFRPDAQVAIANTALVPARAIGPPESPSHNPAPPCGAAAHTRMRLAPYGATAGMRATRKVPVERGSPSRARP